MSVEFTLTFTTEPVPDDGDEVALAKAIDLDPEDLTQLRDLAGIPMRVRLGSAGKGASGPGVAVVLEYSANAAETVAGLVLVGEALRRVIRKILGKRRTAPLIVQDEPAFGALAAASAAPSHPELSGMRFEHAIPISGTALGLGTDERDIWASVFAHSTAGYALLIFMSPSGLVLGETRVPFEIYNDGQTFYRRRTPEEIRQFHQGERGGTRT